MQYRGNTLHWPIQFHGLPVRIRAYRSLLLLIALLVYRVPPGGCAMPIPVLLISLKTLDKGEDLG